VAHRATSRRGDDHHADSGEDPSIPLQVEARLFGQFEVLVRGQPVQQWRGNRGRMLLAFLLLNRSRPLTRDELGGAFWPDAAPGVVRNRLHVALYGLRKDLRALTDHPIVVHGQRGFSIHAGIDLWLDTEVFDTALAATRRQLPGSGGDALACYEKAVGLYRGELLEDAPFEEWALLRRERLRLQLLEALDQVARLRFTAGRYTDCLDACQRLIPGDLCREEIHRLMMRCYTRLNQPHLAVRQYHQCEHQLRDDLGIEPADATRQLYERIRRRELI
jgi:DNA-binding SARP family transcriptional activator